MNPAVLAAETNHNFLQQLDEEGILLSEYLQILVEKTLVDKGVLQTKSAEKILSELA